MTPPRVVCAPDKLRGALDAFAAAAALAEGVRRAGGEPLVCALADGGEGTLDVVCAAGAAERIEVAAHDALGRPVRAAIGDCGRGTYLVEAAEAVGLALLAPRERDPRRTGSGGLADLLRAAVDRGAAHVLVALGGSATVDGGLGLLAGLGARVPGDTGGALLATLDLDLAPARELLAGVQLTVLHDVDVPLCGPDGAAALFGPQKGLKRSDIRPFDEALGRLGAAFGGDSAQRAGAGAAGGLGAALYALGADARSGSDAVIELVGLRDLLAGADLSLTAEGSVDRQSARGKTVAGVVEASRDAGVPCIVLGGRVTPEAIAPLRALGAHDVRAIGPPGRRLDVALAAAAPELAAAAAKAVRAL
ncbi:MAG: glycerate 2-kinase [Gaiellales bacterium]|nr:glycerate 2-kinase [Gaiellales bacterium]